MKLTIVISKSEDYFIGAIKEIPGVISQGNSIEDTRANVLDALELYLEDMQKEKLFANTVLEEDLKIA